MAWWWQGLTCAGYARSEIVIILGIGQWARLMALPFRGLNLAPELIIVISQAYPASKKFLPLNRSSYHTIRGGDGKTN
jgi:hypothetical protein